MPSVLATRSSAGKSPTTTSSSSSKRPKATESENPVPLAKKAKTTVNWIDDNEWEEQASGCNNNDEEFMPNEGDEDDEEDLEDFMINDEEEDDQEEDFVPAPQRFKGKGLAIAEDLMEEAQTDAYFDPDLDSEEEGGGALVEEPGEEQEGEGLLWSTDRYKHLRFGDKISYNPTCLEEITIPEHRENVNRYRQRMTKQVNSTIAKAKRTREDPSSVPAMALWWAMSFERIPEEVWLSYMFDYVPLINQICLGSEHITPELLKTLPCHPDEAWRKSLVYLDIIDHVIEIPGQYVGIGAGEHGGLGRMITYEHARTNVKETSMHVKALWREGAVPNFRALAIFPQNTPRIVVLWCESQFQAYLRCIDPQTPESSHPPGYIAAALEVGCPPGTKSFCESDGRFQPLNRAWTLGDRTTHGFRPRNITCVRCKTLVRKNRIYYMVKHGKVIKRTGKTAKRPRLSFAVKNDPRSGYYCVRCTSYRHLKKGDRPNVSRIHARFPPVAPGEERQEPPEECPICESVPAKNENEMIRYREETATYACGSCHRKFKKALIKTAIPPVVPSDVCTETPCKGKPKRIDPRNRMATSKLPQTLCEKHYATVSAELIDSGVPHSEFAMKRPKDFSEPAACPGCHKSVSVLMTMYSAKNSTSVFRWASFTLRPLNQPDWHPGLFCNRCVKNLHSARDKVRLDAARQDKASNA